MAGREQRRPQPVAEAQFSASARLLDPLATKGPTALGAEPERHRDAWTAYDEIGEVNTLVSSSAGLLSQCRLYPGWVDEHLEERRLRDEKGAAVAPFTEQFVADCEGVLARFADTSGAQRGLLLATSENFDVTGDAYMVGWLVDESGDPWDGPDDLAAGERWEVVSRGALGKAHGQWTLQLSGSRATKLPRNSTAVYRFWRRHPRRPDESRGWVLSALDACRDLRVFTAAQRSAARSSIPSSILVTAQEASPKNVTAHGSPVGGQVPPSVLAGGVPLGPAALAAAPGSGSPPAAPLTWAQTLERLIGDAVMEVLRDAQSGRAVVPAVLAVAERYVSSFHTIDLARPIDSVLGELVTQARQRLAQSADCPPEMLSGLGETNRWNGAQIADDEFRRYFRPKAMAIADAWTSELLWSGLRALGYPDEQVRLVRVLVDARGVVAEPDRSKVASEGLRLGAISWAAWREACGFSEADAPTPEEQAQLLAAFGKSWQQQLEPGEVNRQAGSALVLDSTATETSERATADVAARVPPLTKIVATRTAASTQLPLTADELAEQLAAVEQTTRSRVEEAVEAAFDQALSRAGAKLKNWSRADGDLRALLATVEPRDVAAVLGPAATRRVVADRFADDDERSEDLFAAALVALLLSFRRIARGAYERAARLLGLSIIEPGESADDGAALIAADVERNIDAGEQVLRASLLELADRELFDPLVQPADGERSSLRVPSPVVRRALAAAGGAPVEPGLTGDVEAARGLVFGPTLSRYQPDRLGWRWVYGVELRTHPYLPHLGIDGKVFSGADDEGLRGLAPGGGSAYPGDHYGCLCDWVPVFRDDGTTSDDAA